MAELQLFKVDLDRIGLLEKLEGYSRRMQRSLHVVVVDHQDRVHCGELEKALHINESGNRARDLVVNAHGAGYLVDNEISELYVIGIDISER